MVRKVLWVEKRGLHAFGAEAVRENVVLAKLHTENLGLFAGLVALQGPECHICCSWDENRWSDFGCLVANCEIPLFDPYL